MSNQRQRQRKQNNRERTFYRGAKRIHDWGLGGMATIVFGLLLVISIVLFTRDLQTSVWGYQQFPTNSGDFDISWFVALFFPLLQMGATYMAIALGFDNNKENDKWAWFFACLVLLGMTFDLSTDMMFRLHGNDITAALLFAAFFQTIFIFTLGSEVALTIAFSMLVALWAVRKENMTHKPIYKQQHNQQKKKVPQQQRGKGRPIPGKPSDPPQRQRR